MDRIFIERLAVRGKHGVSDNERANEQEFKLDISIDFDTRTAAASDNLEDTINYDFFRESAKAIVEGQSFHLLERLADAIAQKVLEDKRIKDVSVTVRKTEMYPDTVPGVTVVRTRG